MHAIIKLRVHTFVDRQPTYNNDVR